MSDYLEKLKDPRWQKRRLEVLERDEFSCVACGSTEKTLHVHHLKYSKEPWDSDLKDLKTVCETCHDEIETLKRLVSDPVMGSSYRTNLKRIMLIEAIEPELATDVLIHLFHSESTRKVFREIIDMTMEFYREGQNLPKVIDEVNRDLAAEDVPRGTNA